MAQVTRAVAQGILDGQGYTDNEVRQLAFHWLRSTSNAAGGAPTDEENEVSRQAFNLWYAIRHPKPTHENPTWAHARKCDDYEVWRAASGAYLRRIAELEAELAALKSPAPIPPNSTELEPATPWYPDDSGEWVEVPEDLMEMPANVGRNSLLEVLFQHERDDKGRLECKDIARWCKWDMPAGKGGRIVAYKVVKP